MNDVSSTTAAPNAAGEELSGLVTGIAEQLEGPPSLAELLEVLGWSVPAEDEALMGSFPVPLRLSAKVKGGRWYGSERPSRVGDLNDSAFVDASSFLSLLAEQAAARTGELVSPAVLAADIAAVLKTSGTRFADIEAYDVATLKADVPKRKLKPQPGDVLAIPAAAGGYRLAAVVDRNRFGTALGLLHGTVAFPRLGSETSFVLRRHCFHTDDEQVAAGVWKIVGRDDGLRELFPCPSEIYHGVDLEWPGVDLGAFGAAESAEGQLRLLDENEAREVGLLDGSYRQSYMSEHLQQVLDDDKTEEM
ncbi:hypothetical protein ACFVS7_27740 [Streptomyces rubiginosohelvolus]|uniref:hypothetical protein n=1 Tax=Streptomyces rubiginosohelvolus TaxID=67362 RepID=UPI0036DD23AB